MKFDLERMARISEELEVQFHKVHQCGQSLPGIRSALSGMSGMEEMVTFLGGMQQKLEGNAAGLRDMGAALEKICRSVSSCENRIIDELEMERAVFSQMEVGVIGAETLTRIRGMGADIGLS